MLDIVGRLPWAQRVTVAVLGAATVAAVVGEGLSVPTVPAAVGLVLCGLLPVAVLLVPSAPPAVVNAVAGASIVFTLVCAQLAGRPDNTFGVVELLGLAVLLVRVIIQHRPRQAVAPAALLVVAAALLPLRLADDPYLPLLGTAILFGMAFMALLGMYLRLHDRRRVDAYELARQTQRLSYARDLHDFVAHHITAIVAQAKAVRYTTAAGQPPSPGALDDMLAGIEKAGSQALESMRGMISVLRDDTVPDRQHDTLGALVAAAAAGFVGPPVATAVDDAVATRDLPRQTLDAARHVVQEALTNVLRHAVEVSRVDITVRDGGDEVEITVADDGVGGDGVAGGGGAAPTGLPSGGFGLVGLTERVAAAGGRLTAGPTGAGWAVTAVLPSSPA